MRYLSFQAHGFEFSLLLADHSQGLTLHCIGFLYSYSWLEMLGTTPARRKATNGHSSAFGVTGAVKYYEYNTPLSFHKLMDMVCDSIGSVWVGMTRKDVGCNLSLIGPYHLIGHELP
jgi:hypothetical protein